MHTRAGEANGGVGSAAKQVAEHASAIARLEVELATRELKEKGIAIGVGLGLGVGAAVFGFLVLVFAFLTVAAAFATFLDVWLALLVTTGILALVALLLGLLAYASLKKGTPPVPEQAIEEARLTTEAIKQ
jgi:hypothetical protein